MDFGMPTLIAHDDIGQSVALCRRLRLDFVEINMNLPQYSVSNMDFAKLAGFDGVYFTLHLEEELDPFGFNPAVSDAWRMTALRAVKLARKNGIPAVNMHMPQGVYFTLPDKKVFLYDHYWDTVCAKTRTFRDEMTDAAGGKVSICIENTVFSVFEHLADALNILLESPAFSLTYDCGHDYTDGMRALGFYKAHADRLRHFHLHDALGKKAHLPLGDGELDIPALIDMAQNCRVVLETKDESGLEKSAGYICDYLNRKE